MRSKPNLKQRIGLEMPLTNKDTRGLTQQQIAQQLETIRNQQDQRAQFAAPTQYKQHMPTRFLDAKMNNEEGYYKLLGDVENVGKNATALETIMAQNRRNKEMAEQQQQQSQSYSSGGSGSAPGPIKGFDINAGLGSYNWRGHNLRLNRSVAPKFMGFLEALYAKGYRPSVIGSHAERNIAGTSTKSLHSYGLAIDIDPSKNPVTWNGQNITVLPPSVGALAAKYGLTWGGDWTGSKRDTMHFSMPYNGTK